jgi:hypothetical protein
VQSDPGLTVTISFAAAPDLLTPRLGNWVA